MINKSVKVMLTVPFDVVEIIDEKDSLGNCRSTKINSIIQVWLDQNGYNRRD